MVVVVVLGGEWSFIEDGMVFGRPLPLLIACLSFNKAPWPLNTKTVPTLDVLESRRLVEWRGEHDVFLQAFLLFPSTNQ